MAVEVFGVTYGIVSSDYWSQFTFTDNSTPTKTRVTEIIAKIAASVSGYVVAVGGTPSEIDSTDEPISYGWLGETIGLGAAAQSGRAMSGADPELCREYQRQYEARLKELKNQPEIALADHYDDIGSPAGEVRSHVKKLGHSDAGSDATTYEHTFRMEDEL